MDKSLAQIAINYGGRICSFYLASEWENDIIKLCNEQLRLSAKHEAIELLLVPLRYLGSERFITEEEYNSSSEGIVRKLENLL